MQTTGTSNFSPHWTIHQLLQQKWNAYPIPFPSTIIPIRAQFLQLGKHCSPTNNRPCEFNITGFQNKQLRAHIDNLTSSKTTRIIKRLRLHGIIKKVRGSYKYHLSYLGKQVVALGLKIKELHEIVGTVFGIAD